MMVRPAARVRSMWSLGIGVLALGVSGLTAVAQSDGGNSQDLTRGLTNPKNGGVAGTGMGTTDKPSGGQSGSVGSGGATGTGMSVKGPAGQGITGSDTKGMGDGHSTKPVEP